MKCVLYTINNCSHSDWVYYGELILLSTCPCHEALSYTLAEYACGKRGSAGGRAICLCVVVEGCGYIFVLLLVQLVTVNFINV